MKKFTLLILLLLFLTGCIEQSASLGGVEKRYPNAKIVAVPEIDYNFIVVTNEEVLYVVTAQTEVMIESVNTIYSFNSKKPSRYDSYEELKTVKRTFPEAVIYNLPGEKYKFIIVANDEISYVETIGSTNISKHMTIYTFPIKLKKAIQMQFPVANQPVVVEEKPETKSEWVLKCMQNSNSETCMRTADRLFE